MPRRPSQPCKTPGCSGTARPGKPTCGGCRTRSNRGEGTRRGNPSQRGYGAGHRQRFRMGVLARDRLCRICKRRAAEVADHYPLDRKTLLKMKLDPDDPDYGRGLCTSCHNKHTASVPEQRGGWYRHMG